MFFKLSILLGALFLNNHDLKIIVIEQFWLEIVQFTVNTILRGKGAIKSKGEIRGETTQRGQKRSTTNQSLS